MLTTVGLVLAMLVPAICASAQATSASTSGALTSPTDTIYFSSTITVTAPSQTVSVAGVANSNVASTYWAYYLSVDAVCEDPYDWDNVTIAATNQNGTITLDNMGYWSQSVGQSANETLLFGSHEACCSEFVMCNMVLNGQNFSGGPAALSWDDVDFDIY
jgi:hypothetical protein